jgi:hypothetical protein
MKRVFVRTNWKTALQTLEQGLWDSCTGTDGSEEGVWCDDHPRGGIRAAAGTGVMIGGPEGDTVLCLDVPEELFREREAQESTRPLTAAESAAIRAGGAGPDNLEYQRMGYAIIPAADLNRIGRPQVYDHEYAGNSRQELLTAIRSWEQAAQAEADPSGINEHIRGMREAIEFFDSIGWLTPLRLREEALPDDPLTPGPWFSAEIQEE